MQEKKRRVVRDPYFYWKIVNMALACAVLVLAFLILSGRGERYLMPAAFFLGVVMCSLSGIMELAKNRKIVGYICSVFAGILAVALILDIIRNAGTISGFSPDGKSIIENHLSGILHHLATLSSENESESLFIMAIREEVCKRGYAVNVAELADFFRYTRSQLQYRFSKEYNGNTNLKRFMEDILLELAEKHLQYSSMTLTEIAREMNFPSIYVFSRFYKRKTGVSPLKKRRKTP